MTIIGVISDTHIFDGGRRKVPQTVFDLFRAEGVSLILHGGDLVAWSIIEDLEQIAPVQAVRGNNDPASYGLPLHRRIEVEDIVIGLAHGDVGRTGNERSIPGIKGNGITAASALSHFEFDGDVSCIVFGHSHNPLSHPIQHEGREILLFNPGSPTDRRYASHFACGILRVDGDQLSAKLVVWQ